MLKRLRSILLGVTLLTPVSTGNAATWCELFDNLMLDLREHQFSCKTTIGKYVDCTTDDPKVKIPDSVYCSILIPPGLEDRVYHCRFSQPTKKLTSLWGQYVWNYFHFCASNDLLATKGRIERETSQPFLAYKADGRLYTVALEEDGTDFRVTMERAR